MRDIRLVHGMIFIAAGALLIIGSFGASWAVAPNTDINESDAEMNETDLGYETLLIGVQSPRSGGSVTEITANGTPLWTYGQGNDGGAISYFDVSKLDDGRVLASFADDGYEDCGPYEPPCVRTGVRTIDPDPEPHTVNEWSYPVRSSKNSEVHDAEVLPSGELLVADMEYESIFTVDPSTGEQTWRWNASTYYDPPDDPTREDWLHINDVDRIGEGRYLVSVRNANQILIIERGTGVVEVINEDQDPNVLNEQHNPQWLGDGKVLVSDSENDRIVELHWNETRDEWVVTWTLNEAGGIGLDWPRDADRLPNGNTVVTDSRNNRVVVVDANRSLIRSYSTAALPYEADPLPAGEMVNPAGDVAPMEVNETGAGAGYIPVFSSLLAAISHVVPVPFWVEEWHLISVVIAVILWTWGGILISRGGT